MTTLTTAEPSATWAPPPMASLPAIETHARQLGFDTLLQYRLWCHRQGFGGGLDKPAGERARERAAARGRPTARHQVGRRREMLEGVAAGAVNLNATRRLDGPGRPGRRAAVAAPPVWLQVDAPTRRALLEILVRYDRFGDVLYPRAIVKHARRQKRLQWGLLALAWQHRAWVRPVETWEPERLGPKGTRHLSHSGLFRSLARHLLARYEVPPFMDSAWFEMDWEVALTQQRWWIAVAQGGNIRHADTPIQLTRRMAHAFLQAPNNDSLMRNLRWAQVIGMGGDEPLARAVLRTRLGRRFDDDEFWRSVVLFLVNNAMLDPTWVGPVVDYVYNMKYAPRRILREEGGVEEGPPPQPDFTMKGRSATKLLRQVEAWHGDLSRQRYVAFQTWQTCGIRGFELDDETEMLGRVGWTVQELTSSWELAAEGTALNHCVVSYSDQCADGDTAIFSICARRQGAAERDNVLTVAVDLRERAVTQARGKYNAQPNSKPKNARLRQAGQGGYLDLLNRSDHVLRTWIDRERLHRSS